MDSAFNVKVANFDFKGYTTILVENFILDDLNARYSNIHIDY